MSIFHLAERGPIGSEITTRFLWTRGVSGPKRNVAGPGAALAKDGAHSMY